MTDDMAESANLFPSVRIVLVETSHPGNIGAAARAMKNMGLTRLYLVSPEDFPNEKAVFRSASACLLYTSPSPRDLSTSRMPSSA